MRAALTSLRERGELGVIGIVGRAGARGQRRLGAVVVETAVEDQARAKLFGRRREGINAVGMSPRAHHMQVSRLQRRRLAHQLGVALARIHVKMAVQMPASDSGRSQPVNVDVCAVGG